MRMARVLRSRPYHEIRQQLEDVKARWSSDSGPFGMYDRIGGVEARSFIANAIADACRRLSVTGLAMHRHRARHGRFPEALEKLVPEFLQAVPVDPFDGASIRFRPETHGSTLYSVGPDGVDGGGRRVGDLRLGEEGDIVFLLGPSG